MGYTVDSIYPEYTITNDDIEITFLFYLESEWGLEEKRATVSIPLKELASSLKPFLDERKPNG